MTTVSLLDKLNNWANDKLTPYATPQNIESMRESCIFNIITHGTMGFAFGGLIGLFLAGMASTGPEANILNPSASPATSIPLRIQAKQVFKDIAGRSWSSARNFGKIAAIFTGFECVVETYRAKHDIGNTVAAGCLTGGVLAAKAGPKAALAGCVGFAAFSAAIEHFLQDHTVSDD